MTFYSILGRFTWSLAPSLIFLRCFTWLLHWSQNLRPQDPRRSMATGQVDADELKRSAQKRPPRRCDRGPVRVSRPAGHGGPSGVADCGRDIGARVVKGFTKVCRVLSHDHDNAPYHGRATYPPQPLDRAGDGAPAAAGAPTSTPSGSRYSRFGVSVSFATLPPLTQRSLCCIDRLNPQTEY